MRTITAIIRVKAGQEAGMRDALQAVADYVHAHEPDTMGFFIAQGDTDPCVFTTYERFTDQAAMDRHNASSAVAAFFDRVQPILDGPVTLVTALETSARP
ncbi:putative quinol monooxygenase [Rhizobium sp. SL86]|jgi:quinol monooxygenase YgiN|uniref:putative quinol monooxygenase n=1 Tax=Rhizobium sp. SL86 TaxID=2995148 RepID=UPI002275B3FC|nr:antibiotic biosynthesis monooxygenase [Rhizobium sp. SL86]MCY1667658.1 antibiotic biosynthesis monooxygenase [Rhizobium sp. SL86]